MAQPEFFPEGFEEQLGYGKYTNWILLSAFAPEHLFCLCCICGEFGARALQLLRILWDHVGDGGADRSVLALDALCCFMRGDRFDKSAWARNMGAWRRIREAGAMPADEVDEHAGKPGILPAALVMALARESRARWAAAPPLTEAHLQCLLWLIGEFSARADAVLRPLEERRAELGDAARALVALQVLHALVWHRERFDVREFDERAARGRALLEFDDLPQPVRAALLAPALAERWGTVRRTPWGYQLVGRNDSGEYRLEADVRLPDEVAFKRLVNWDAIPPAVTAAIAMRFPDFHKSWAYGRLARDGSVGAYEIEYQPKLGKFRRSRRIVVSQDGSELREAEM
jgi:hypothetical protein